jgi:hypothetical protein
MIDGHFGQLCHATTLSYTKVVHDVPVTYTLSPLNFCSFHFSDLQVLKKLSRLIKINYSISI